MVETGQPPDLFSALSAFVRALPEPAPDYCLIGALALGVWGAVRATQDIDFLILLDEKHRDALTASLSAAGFELDRGWSDLNPMVGESVTRFRFGLRPVDLLHARDAFHREALARRRAVAIENLTIEIASPEDLILLKLRAGRDQDFVDVAGIVTRQKSALDLGYMRAWAGRLGLTGELEYALKAGAA
jgi:hypothetical protein